MPYDNPLRSRASYHLRQYALNTKMSSGNATPPSPLKFFSQPIIPTTCSPPPPPPPPTPPLCPSPTYEGDSDIDPHCYIPPNRPNRPTPSGSSPEDISDFYDVPSNLMPGDAPVDTKGTVWILKTCYCGQDACVGRALRRLYGKNEMDVWDRGKLNAFDKA